MEDEQDQGHHGPRREGADGAEGGPWEGAVSGEEEEGEEGRRRRQERLWSSAGPGDDPSAALSGQDYTTESDEGGGRREDMQTDVRARQLHTPDTDAPNTSDADVPPSYSKAVSFDRLEVSDDSDLEDRRLMAMTPDSRSDYLSDPLLPSATTELTASELLLNKIGRASCRERVSSPV